MAPGLFAKVAGVWTEIGSAGGLTWAKVTGGTVTEYTKPDGSVMEVHTFTANGTLTVESAGYAEVLVCGAGAGGQAGTFPSSGGGGGVRFGTFALPSGALTATVPAAPAASTSGGPASLGTILSVGGGFHNVQPSGINPGGGGAAPSNGNTSGSGGGGAGGSGDGTNPGPGIVSSITGTAVEYGKGGDLNVDPTLPGQGGKQGAFPGSAGIVIVAVQKSAPTLSGIFASGGTEDTFVGDGTIGQIGVTYKRHTFDADGTLTVTQGGEATLILVGAGGTTGHNNTAAEQIGAGGGGGVLQTTVTLSAGTHPVGVGVAGATGRALPGGPTYVGQFSVPGGGTGSSNRNGAGGDGGSGGGGGDGTGVGGKGIPGIGNNGGNGGGSPDGGGGGGAGGAGVGPVGGPGRTIWGVEYGKGGSVVSTGLGTAPVANSGSGESISQGNNSRIVAANGRAFIFYPVA